MPASHDGIEYKKERNIKEEQEKFAREKYLMKKKSEDIYYISNQQ